jgi:acetyl-CoA synthetase
MQPHPTKPCTYAPPTEFAEKARWRPGKEFDALYADAAKDPEKFWAAMATAVDWERPWSKVLEWNAPDAKWFVGARVNASVQCLDRHLSSRGDKTAIVFEAEDGTVRELTYRELARETCRLANALEALGAKAGDTAAIYMPLVPEAVVAMLACARLGVTHSVIFAGFSAHAVRDRVVDANSRFVLTADVGYRKGEALPLVQTVAEAVEGVHCVERVVVLRRTTDPLPASLGARAVDWGTVTASQPDRHLPRAFDAEHPLFILYTSGTTGKPKGIVHSTGGYLVGAITTTKYVFDLRDDDRYWCTADIGWITGHTYVVYGVLGLGGTVLLYEGNLMYPSAERFWSMIDRHRVTILYTAPTAIRGFMRLGDDGPAKFRFDSLRLLGSVGEPINPEAWAWYHRVVGRGRCPIVDTWWQTETGAHMITPIPGVTPLKPGSATRPFPGILADVVDDEGRSCPPNVSGYLVVRGPWPSMLRGIHGDRARFVETYWSQFPGMYFTGDGAYRDDEGYFWISGRIDDVLNVSGHRLGTAEIESALVSHPSVAEAAAVGRPDELKGQAVVAFVIPKEAALANADWKALEEELKRHVAKEIGAIARPDAIHFTKQLPKTRSGKILRRLLKNLAAGQTGGGDTTTLENATLVELLN